MLTSAGVRSRSLKHSTLTPYSDYHGAYTCWGVTNSILVTGLRRQGFDDLASEMARRYLSALREAGAILEFFYVDDEGNAIHPLRDRTEGSPQSEIVFGTNRPEKDQAWTLSFLLREILHESHSQSAPTISQRKKTSNARVSEWNGPAFKPGCIDLDAAKELERTFIIAQQRQN